MDNRKKDLLLHLYGEHPQESDLRSLLKDEELRSEYQALSEVKFRLDHRRRERPDPAVLDGVLAASGDEALAGAGLRAADRMPVPPHSSLRRVLIPAVSIAAAIVLGVSIGWFARGPEAISPVQTAQSTMDDNVVPPESLFRFVPPGTGLIAPASATDPMLAWDEADRVRSLHRRIETLQRSNTGLDWGEPTVPLEALPGGRNPAIRTAGSNRP